MPDPDQTLPPRWGLGFLATALLPAALLADLLLALSRGWRFESRADLLAAAAAGLAMLLAVSLAATRRGRKFYGDNRLQLVMLCVVVGFSLLAAEAFLRFYVSGDAPLHCRYPHTRRTFQPVPRIMPGVSGTAIYQTNSHGVRGPEFPARRDAYRILCLGGSTTECVYLDQDESWPALIRHGLDQQPDRKPVWVGSAGISGYTSVQHVKFAEHSPLMKEIDCLCVLVGVNDLTRFLEDERLETDRQLIEAEMRRVRPWWYRSSIRSLLRRVALQNAAQLTVHAEDPEGRVYDLRRQKRIQADRRTDLPELSAALSEYQERIRLLIENCRRHGVRPIVLSQPVVWREDLSPELDTLLWLGWSPDGRYYTAACLREGMDRFNAAAQQACSESQAEWVDLSSMNGQERYFLDGCHFNEAGAAEIARLVLEHLSTADAAAASK